MTIARPAGSGGGVTAAEVNLKFVWEVVSRIKIGDDGPGLCGRSTGTLIAHPDISLVLKKSDLNGLPQVAALTRPDASSESIGRDLKGDEVFTAHAAIPTLRWTVFVESPRAEALAPLMPRWCAPALLLVAGLVVSTAATFFVARALVRPLQALQEGAARVGAGELDRRIEVHTGRRARGPRRAVQPDGRRAAASYTGLERKVEERTAELSEALEHQTAISEVLRVISESPTDVSRSSTPSSSARRASSAVRLPRSTATTGDSSAWSRPGTGRRRRSRWDAASTPRPRPRRSLAGRVILSARRRASRMRSTTRTTTATSPVAGNWRSDHRRADAAGRRTGRCDPLGWSDAGEFAAAPGRRC